VHPGRTARAVRVPAGGRAAGPRVPAGLAETVAQRVEVSALLRDLLEEISAVNLELLSRRELD
jgi:hypothetical protein